MNHANKRKKKATTTIQGLNRRWGVPDGCKLEVTEPQKIWGLDKNYQ